jgi:tRNA 2-thiouridine synthesizing protein A
MCSGMTTHDLDAIGLLCPLPVLKLRKRLKALAPGDCVLLNADDPAAIVDVPHFCAETGSELVKMTDHGATQSYLVRKGG